ncbi:MAG TPA: O-acetyl-ADP-ribose deacetylase [Leptospiraceae bacterium]|nr:O-acetyl-ADP-ribose deacetylase [Leptospirales bacterium]HMW61328.1 O-acetyl-ADP-ribose deacetylase [Leptospiraceae bacterium]HMX56038.1 O-acetyl-ADP-ribose deacetylase [Leptospiraceae bacterium]HMY46980.1 O-acetyl-ADP-ribose deacetylase [Leptospiraceae bacterium]HNE23841.1 O-acetyl-ADP-ribose deacetylase [Leptospiraceae bacterium]
MDQYKEEKKRIRLVRADITKLSVDAIVNAANESLLGGGGVDGAIHSAAGPDLLRACAALKGCKTGQAKITPGFQLPAKYVIHTVGPVYRGGMNKESELLASCYQSSLAVASHNNVNTIAFPSISTGVYGYPIEEACRIAIVETLRYLSGHSEITEVTFVCFSDRDLKIYERAMTEF